MKKKLLKITAIAAAVFSMANNASAITKTWTGTGGLSWFTSANWSPNGVPSVTDDVIIPVTANTVEANDGNQIAECQSLTINSGATVNCYSSINVTTTLIINGTLNYNSTGSLKYGGTSVTGSGSVTVAQNAAVAGANRYHFWSSPFLNNTFPIFTIPGNNYYAWLGSAWANASGNMDQGEGYAIYNSSSLSFTAPATSTNFSTSVFQFSTGGPSGYTLVGNPYPCTIDASTFITNPTNTLSTTGSLYFWDDDGSAGTGWSTGDYAVRNSLGGTAANSATPNGKISKCQGFFVQNSLSPGFVVFDKNMQLDYTVPHPTFFSANTNELVWIKGMLGTKETQTLIGFSANATNGIDYSYDAEKFFSTSSIGVYSMMGGTAYTINGMAPFTGYKEVEFGAFAPAGQVMQIAVDSSYNIDVATTIYLYDALNGTYTDIKNGSFNYIGTGIQENNRFKVVFNPTITGLATASTTDFSVEAYPNPSNTGIFTLYTKDACNVTVTDVLGNVVHTQRLTNQRNELNLEGFAKGVYTVNMVYENGSKVISVVKSN